MVPGAVLALSAVRDAVSTEMLSRSSSDISPTSSSESARQLVEDRAKRIEESNKDFLFIHGQIVTKLLSLYSIAPSRYL